MNLIPPAKKRGFPAMLAVGLVVIFGFIGLLFGKSRSTAHARKATSLAAAIALEGGIESFYNEYGAIPDVGKSHFQTDTPEGAKLLTILLGLEGTATPPQNKRAIKFLLVKEGRSGKNGILFDPKTNLPTGLLDHTGTPYTIELNSQYKDRLQFTFGSRSMDFKDRQSAVYSLGPDGIPETSDDVRTW